MDARLPAPTPSELKILQCLWQHGPCTVREVHDHMAADCRVSYTTTLKQLQIMYSKELVRRDDRNRAHVYNAIRREESTQLAMLNDFVARVYGGSWSQLVLQALGMTPPASNEELDEIQRRVRTLRNQSDSRADETTASLWERDRPDSNL